MTNQITYEPWQADITVTEALVRTCLQDQFPALMPIVSLHCIGEGWDNKVFLLNKKIIFRFPRRKVAVELIKNENDLLNNLQPLFEISIPQPIYPGWPSKHYPYFFQGYPLLQGLPAERAELSDKERLSSLFLMGHFLKQLHSIRETEALKLGATQQVFDRTDIKKTVHTLQERVKKIVTNNIFSLDKNAFEKEIARAQAINKLPDERCLVHGDLYCRHLLFNRGQLRGIIDWGDAGISHRAVDLSVLWSFYPAYCHAEFFEVYGEVDAATWQYARFLGLYIILTVLLYGHAVQDKALMTEAIRAIQSNYAHLHYNQA